MISPLKGFSMINATVVEKTGTGKTHDTITHMREMIANTEHNALIIAPDLQGADLFAEAIGEGAEVFRSVTRRPRPAKRTQYTHELKIGSFEHCRVVIITHTKALAVFNGTEVNRELSNTLNKMMQYEITDEYLSHYEELMFAHDDLFRLYHYYNFKSHVIYEMLDYLDGESDYPKISLDRLENEVNVWLEKYPHFRRIPIARSKKNKREALEMFGYVSHKPRKKTDSIDPTEFERQVMHFVGYKEVGVVKPDGAAKGAIVCYRPSGSQIPKRMMLDATYELLANSQKVRSIIAPTKPRTYTNTTVHNMKWKGEKGCIANRYNDVIKANILIKGKTLIVARKSTLDDKFGKTGESYRERFEALGHYVTHFGADKGTNSYQDAKNVLILQLSQPPGFLKLAKEVIYGENTLPNEEMAQLVQLMNRGICRMGDNEMKVILPREVSNINEVLADQMPGIKFSEDKLQAISKYLYSQDAETIILSKLSLKGFERPKSINDFIGKNKTKIIPVFEAAGYIHNRGKLTKNIALPSYLKKSLDYLISIVTNDNLTTF